MERLHIHPALCANIHKRWDLIYSAFHAFLADFVARMRNAPGTAVDTIFYVTRSSNVAIYQ